MPNGRIGSSRPALIPDGTAWTRAMLSTLLVQSNYANIRQTEVVVPPMALVLFLLEIILSGSSHFKDAV